MIEQQQEEQYRHREFSTNFPASDIPLKNYSLEADMATGWRPKSKIIGPIPFNFDNQVVDELVDQLTSFGSRYKERVIYLGPRFQSSFKLHQQMKHEYRFKYQSLISGSFSHMAAYFRKFHSNFKSKKSATRIFNGMNPILKASQELVFDGNFESGNLDAAIRVGQNQYDLFMRIDTNTRGHVQWFNFTVRNNGKKKVRFNIVNFKKYKSLYSRDMKPYIYSQHLKQTKDLDWHQGGINVKYEKQILRYQFLSEIFLEETMTYNCLKFDYIFDTEWETVQFCYCPPFTYSQMLNMISSLKKNMFDIVEKPEEYYIKQQVLCESLGGLDIPLLTITDPEVQDKSKRVMLLSARIHPGETCGSHMMKGFLDFICSNNEAAQQLRKKAIFKVIPMLNPDGVVVGNFRTSLCGRDLNRQFRTSADFLIPQVRGLKQLVIALKSQYKNKFIFFLDFHGHSVKKNVFLYGPEYEIWENNYYRTRIFPKLLSIKTQMFRYYSCLFRIADFKRTTARAVILNNVPHCYTIQASTGFYYSQEDKKDITFTPASWALMGKMVGQGIKDYMDLMYDQEMTKLQRKQKLNQLKSNRVKHKQKVQKSQSRTGNFHTRIVSISSSHKHNQQKVVYNHGLSQRAREMIQQLKHQEALIEQKKKQQGHDSDNYSEGGSDSEGAEDDIPEEQLTTLHQQIVSSIKEFRMNFYNKSERLYSYKQPRHKTNNQKRARQSVKLKGSRQSKGIEMIASLRKKAQQMLRVEEGTLKWPKMRQQSKSLVANISKDTGIIMHNKTKTSFKTCLQHIEKDRKYIKGNGSGLLQVHGQQREFKDNNLIKN